MHPQLVPPALSIEATAYRGLVLAVRDYIYKNGFKGALIGLSGGIDSALTLTIAIDAIGKENVHAVLMPSRYTSEISIQAAKEQVEKQGVISHYISIEPIFQAFLNSLSADFSGLPIDQTEENLQARCRGTLLMALSNKTGRLVLTTGNKSEMAVGYATLYGDMAGGFAVLKDVPKTLVYRLAHYRNQLSAVIPQIVIERPPTAELALQQKDEDSLPPYAILDPILEMYVEQDKSPAEIIAAGFTKETVYGVIAMVDRNEYKRRQAAPGPRITTRAFTRERRYPITSKYRVE
jgi:NAD+ synthase (glutamine-hydrolysing)